MYRSTSILGAFWFLIFFCYLDTNWSHLRKRPHHIGHRQACVALSWLIFNVVGSRPLWMAFLPWAMILGFRKSKLSKLGVHSSSCLWKFCPDFHHISTVTRDLQDEIKLFPPQFAFDRNVFFIATETSLGKQDCFLGLASSVSDEHN